MGYIAIAFKDGYFLYSAKRFNRVVDAVVFIYDQYLKDSESLHDVVSLDTGTKVLSEKIKVVLNALANEDILEETSMAISIGKEDGKGKYKNFYGSDLENQVEAELKTPMPTKKTASKGTFISELGFYESELIDMKNKAIDEDNDELLEKIAKYVHKTVEAGTHAYYWKDSGADLHVAFNEDGDNEISLDDVVEFLPFGYHFSTIEETKNPLEENEETEDEDEGREEESEEVEERTIERKIEAPSKKKTKNFKMNEEVFYRNSAGSEEVGVVVAIGGHSITVKNSKGKFVTTEKATSYVLE